MAATEGLESTLESPNPDARYYSAYGALIRSDFTLSGVPAATYGDAQVVIERGKQLTHEKDAHYFQLELPKCVMFWPEIARFTISGTDHVLVETFSGVADDLVSLPLLGPVFALLMHRRGLTVMHGSAIAFGKSVAVFVGDKGAGKSTFAAFCVRSGHRILSDDVVGIRDDGMAMPSSNQMKLTRQTDEMVCLDAPRSASPHVDFDKVIRNVEAWFSPEPGPTKRIFVLERGEKAAVRSLTATEALQAVLRFSYVVRFTDYVVRTGGAPAQLAACARLAGRIRVLVVPDGLEALGSVVSLVERELETA